ncbi:MAG: class I SAM-dependent methyltransferase [Phycisphaerae bacterium]|nr:class I SAM-dependent methyltransferase [Phycisphaerae bacterium]
MDTARARDVLGEQFDFIFEDADRLIQYLGLPKDARILDVGTGMGHFAITLALNGYSVLTGEPASDDSIYARQGWLKNAQAVGVDHLIQFKPFEAQDMPFDDASFDAVFFFGVLHHVDETARTGVLQEAFRTAKPGAVISFLEPNQECMKIVMEHDPSHPDPADPTAYAHGLAMSQQTVKGRFFDSTIFRKGSD